MENRNHIVKRSGFSIAAWAADVGISRASYYIIPQELRPKQLKIGDRTIVYEHPTAWLERMGRMGGVTLSRKKPEKGAKEK